MASRAPAARTTPVTTLARLVLHQALVQWQELATHLAWRDERIAAHAKDNDPVKADATQIDIGPVTASAAIATVVDFRQFTCGAQFGAWLAPVPSQHSGCGKSRLGGITKRGAVYRRTMLIQGAKSAVVNVHQRGYPTSHWVAALRERSAWQKALAARHTRTDLSALRGIEPAELWCAANHGVASERRSGCGAEAARLALRSRTPAGS